MSEIPYLLPSVVTVGQNLLHQDSFDAETGPV
jgi:hypothetical protein